MLSPLGASDHAIPQPSPDAKTEGKNQKFIHDLYRRFNIKPLNACSLPNASPCRSRGVLKPLLKNEDEAAEEEAKGKQEISKVATLKGDKLKVVGSQKKMNMSVMNIGLQSRTMRKRESVERFSSTFHDNQEEEEVIKTGEYEPRPFTSPENT